MAPWIWTALAWFAGIAIVTSIMACAVCAVIWFNDRQNSAGVSDE